MAIEVKIVGANGKVLEVNEEQQAQVVVHPHPPKDESLNALPFRSYFTEPGGSNDMLVDGSVTPVDFAIRAIPEDDIYIKTISVLIADASATLAKFGNLGALTNGVEFFWSSQDEGKIIINEGIKTNFEFVRLSGGNPAFGNSTNAFIASNVSGSSEGFIPVIDLTRTFGLPWGVRLRKGTKDELTFCIKDNVSTMDGFNIVGYGIKF